MGKMRLLTLLGCLCLFAYSVETMKIPQKQNPESLKWWQEGIIYQIYPRSHMDSNGDGVGDLAGIESRLDYFTEIGISAVWISPIYKSPMKDFGYDISNFTDIEPVFGDMDSFRSLSEALKARDIKLVMDFVPNHSSDEHEWFQKSIAKVDPYTDYYVWKNASGEDADGKPLPPNGWVSVFGGSAWEWNEQRQQFYYHHFVAGQPDLNFENRAVINEMLAAMNFWLDEGVDGFRFDAVPHMFEDPELREEPEDPNRPPEALPDEYRYYLHPYTYNLPAVRDTLAQFRQLMDIYSAANGKELCMMVEATIPTMEGLFEYYGNETHPIAHFPFNFEFIHRTKAGFNGSHVLKIVDEWFAKMPEGKTANWLVGNHDNHRVEARFGGDWIVDILNMIIHLLPGSSVTYYGEEIGMQDTWISWEDTVDPAGCQTGPDRYEQFSRDPERTPMQWDDTKNAGFSTGDTTWLPVNANFTTINVKAQSGVAESHLEIYKQVSQLRKTDVFRFGSLETAAANEGDVFGFSRIYNGKGFAILANFGPAEISVDAASEFEGLPATATVYTRSSGFTPESTLVGGSVNTGSISIGSQHALIIEF